MPQQFGKGRIEQVAHLFGADLAASGKPLGELGEAGDVDEGKRPGDALVGDVGRRGQPLTGQAGDVGPQALLGLGHVTDSRRARRGSQAADAIHGFALVKAQVSSTTERKTSPRCIFVNASSTSPRPMVSLTNCSSGRRPCRCRSTSIGKSRDGRQSPYQLELTDPPRPKTSINGSSRVMSGVGTPTSTTRPAKSRP